KHAANHNEFLFDFDCDEKTKRLCDNQTIILNDSTFSLIIPPLSPTSLYDDEVNDRLFNSLAAGAIPVLLGGDYLKLPFEEVVDWNKAVIRIPVARITELYVLIKTFTDSDIIELKRFGNYYFRSYFSNTDRLVSTLLTF